MEQRNMHAIDLENNWHGEDLIRPEPCVFYGSFPSFLQPGIQTIVPGGTSNFISQQLFKHHEISSFYGMTPYNQSSSSTCNPAAAFTLNNFCQYMACPSGSRGTAFPLNHGAHGQFCFSTGHGMVGIPTDDYILNNPHGDDVRGSFKGKIAEGLPLQLQSADALAGSSFVITPVGTRPLDSGATLTNGVPLAHPGSRANDSSAVIEDGTLQSIRNRHGVAGPESVLAHNANHFIQANCVGQLLPLPGNPWFGLEFRSNCGNVNRITWNQPSILPCLPGSINGVCAEVGDVGLQGHQVASNSSFNSFLPPPSAQEHLPIHYSPFPFQGVRSHNMDFISQLPSPSCRFPINDATLNSFHGGLETGPGYVGLVPPAGLRFYWPAWQETTQAINIRLRDIPHLREVAIMDLSGYHESGNSIDQHRDMRLDIEHMSYEELLALGEQIGSVGTGLSEEVIASGLKVRLFASSTACSDVDDPPGAIQEVDFCVICQAEYKGQEQIGTLDCGHEYHAGCIKNWLLVKNACPICKSITVASERKDL